MFAIIVLKLLISLESIRIWFLFYSPFSPPSTLFSFSCQHNGRWLCSFHDFWSSSSIWLDDIYIIMASKISRREFLSLFVSWSTNTNKKLYIFCLLYSIISTLTKELPFNLYWFRIFLICFNLTHFLNLSYWHFDLVIACAISSFNPK